MANSVLIKNGTLVSSEEERIADVLVLDGRIAKVGENLDQEGAERVVDAQGLHVIPGVLDPQVHFRDPGTTHKEDLHTGSVCAAAGGVTSFFDMPNNKPSITTRELMKMKKEIAAEKCVVNYNFFIGATSDNVEELNATPNVNGIKIFMGSSTGDLLVEKREDLEKIFSNGTRLIAVHAENNDIIEENTKKIMPSDNFADHANIRSVEAALAATKLAVELALKYNRRLHVLHLTSKDEAEFLAQFKGNPLISTEVCPQHFTLSSPESYDRLGSFAQMNPPIRTPEHGEALWKALKEGVIDCIATDHAPHTIEEKNQPFGSAPSGMPGVETSLPLMLNRVSEGLCSLQEVVKWMCENPVKIYGVQNKGFLKEGYDGDITIVDMNLKKEIKSENMHTKVRWTPFDGMMIHGWPVTTIVGGQVVFENGEVNEDIRGTEIQINQEEALSVY